MTEEEAMSERFRLFLEEGEDLEDLKVEEMCEQHSGQPKTWCEVCESKE